MTTKNPDQAILDEYLTAEPLKMLYGSETEQTCPCGATSWEECVCECSGCGGCDECVPPPI